MNGIIEALNKELAWLDALVDALRDQPNKTKDEEIRLASFEAEQKIKLRELSLLYQQQRLSLR